jgi:GT2 family glycosyltransferase
MNHSSSSPLTPTIYILLPVHNRRETTLLFVECLKEQTDQDFHLVLIDDGSNDGTADAVRSRCCKLTVIKGSGNWWWGGALHQGYQWMKSRQLHVDDVVLLINDDVVFKPDYLEKARALMAANPSKQIGSHYLEKDTLRVLDRGAACCFKKFIITSAKSDHELTFLSTRGLFLSASSFLESEGFVPDQLPHYLSDYEFTHRLREKHGLKMMTSDLIPVMGLSDVSGESSLHGVGSLEALKIISSVKFRGNPIFLARFVRLCFPKQHHFAHVKYVWILALKRWFFTWPQPIITVILMMIFPARSLLAGIKNGFLQGVRKALDHKQYHLEREKLH